VAAVSAIDLLDDPRSESGDDYPRSKGVNDPRETEITRGNCCDVLCRDGSASG
jgi:hypothetical protein